MKASQAKDAPHALPAPSWDNGHMHIISVDTRSTQKKCVGSKWNPFECVCLLYAALQAFLSILTGLQQMIGGLMSCNVHLIASQHDSISSLTPAGSNPFLSEANGGLIAYPTACWC